MEEEEEEEEEEEDEEETHPKNKKVHFISWYDFYCDMNSYIFFRILWIHITHYHVNSYLSSEYEFILFINFMNS